MSKPIQIKSSTGYVKLMKVNYKSLKYQEIYNDSSHPSKHRQLRYSYWEIQHAYKSKTTVAKILYPSNFMKK